VAAKTQESSVNHTTRLYGVPSPILESGGGGHRVHVSYQRDFIIGHRLDLRERLRETQLIDLWSKIVGDFIAAHSAPVGLREGILYVRVLQPALHYELEQIAKPEILRKLKQRFGSKTIRDIRFSVG
jgi:Dna[CI] antecedent DciA-like protein